MSVVTHEDRLRGTLWAHAEGPAAVIHGETIV